MFLERCSEVEVKGEFILDLYCCPKEKITDEMIKQVEIGLTEKARIEIENGIPGRVFELSFEKNEYQFYAFVRRAKNK